MTDPDPARVVRSVGSIELEDVRDAACSKRLDSGTVERIVMSVKVHGDCPR